MEAWTRINNLHLNHTKCAEITSIRRARRSAASLPPTLPDIARLSSLKIPGVTISRRLSVSDHVQNVVASCAQTLHDHRQLCVHGLVDTPLSHLQTDAADRGGCSIGRDPRGIRTLCVVYPYCVGGFPHRSSAIRSPILKVISMFHVCCGCCR